MTTTTTTTTTSPPLPTPPLLRQFQHTCQRTVQRLHETHGYSRERAKRLVYRSLTTTAGTATTDSSTERSVDPEEVSVCVCVLWHCGCVRATRIITRVSSAPSLSLSFTQTDFPIDADPPLGMGSGRPSMVYRTGGPTSCNNNNSRSRSRDVDGTIGHATTTILLRTRTRNRSSTVL